MGVTEDPLGRGAEGSPEHHVFAWVAGFGWTLMPYAPYRFEQVPGQPPALRVRHFTAGGERQAVVSVPASGGEPEFELAPGTASLDEVLEVLRGAAYAHWTTAAAYDHWRVETYALTFRLPAGFALRSLPSDSQPPFELEGPDGARIWIQGPLRETAVPALDRMAGPNQTTDRIGECAGGPLVELTYRHEGAPWRMFHCVVDRNPPRRRSPLSFLRREPPRYLCLVSAQTPEAEAAAVRAAVAEVAASLTPCPVEPSSD